MSTCLFVVWGDTLCWVPHCPFSFRLHNSSLKRALLSPFIDEVPCWWVWGRMTDADALIGRILGHETGRPLHRPCIQLPTSSQGFLAP